MRIPLAVSTFGVEEVQEVIDSLETGRLTMGDKCRAFEGAFAAYTGAKHAIYVNSGSSANLLVWFALANSLWREPLSPGFEVIVPAVAWSTTIWPIVQAGGTPVLVDCDPETLAIRADAIEAAVTPNTAGIFLVHPMGNVCDLPTIKDICEKHDILLLEDTCEALGARHGDGLAGCFGLMGTFSFYFSHHISTVEGGMIVTDEDEAAALLKVLRSHGWSRQDQSASDIDFSERYKFITTGFNLRPSELNAAFGVHQIKKLAGFNENRVRAFAAMQKAVAPLIDRGALKPMQIQPMVEAVPFGFPALCTSSTVRDKLAVHLESQGIETRPIICGNMARQPAMAHINHRVSGSLNGADLIMDQGLYWAIHPYFGDDEVAYVADALMRFDQW